MLKDLKATMGPFAGWDMPMIYKGVSIPESVKVSSKLKPHSVRLTVFRIQKFRIQTSNYFQLKYDIVTIITWLYIKISKSYQIR